MKWKEDRNDLSLLVRSTHARKLWNDIFKLLKEKIPLKYKICCQKILLKVEIKAIFERIKDIFREIS